MVLKGNVAKSNLGDAVTGANKGYWTFGDGLKLFSAINKNAAFKQEVVAAVAPIAGKIVAEGDPKNTMMPKASPVISMPNKNVADITINPAIFGSK